MRAATDLDLDVIEHLDFSPTLPCEHSQHDSHHASDDPARWTYSFLHPTCGRSRTYLICESGRLRLLSSRGIRCRGCGYIGPISDLIFTFLPIEATP